MEEVKKEVNTAVATGNKPFNKGKKDFNKGDRKPREDRRENKDGLSSKLVKVGRVVKVTKGGKNAKFNSIVIAGDKNGRVGIGSGKALETPNAIEKATIAAKKHLVMVNLDNGTIPHQVRGKFGASEVIMIPAKEGTGVIAGGAVRAVLEMVGIKNITCKSYGSRNKTNLVKATLDGLLQLRTKEQVEKVRAKQVAEEK